MGMSGREIGIVEAATSLTRAAAAQRDARALHGPIKWLDIDAECMVCHGIITRGDQAQVMVQGPLNVVVGIQHEVCPNRPAVGLPEADQGTE